MTRVAIIEDNQDLLDDVTFSLERAGFTVRGCASGEDFDSLRESFQPQVVVVDIGLPGEDGLSIVARLRAASPGLGIVMLTARTMLEDRIAGHDQGADNYLCKPVEMEELIAVISARARAIDVAAGMTSPWRFNARQLLLQSPDGQGVELTNAERQVLSTLLAAPDQQATRHALILALGGNPNDYDFRRLEVVISRLRQKIRSIRPATTPLRALRNQGYVFAEPVQLD